MTLLSYELVEWKSGYHTTVEIEEVLCCPSLLCVLQFECCECQPDNISHIQPFAFAQNFPFNLELIMNNFRHTSFRSFPWGNDSN